ncbi:hypothetical protein BYT27DRAFT_7164032 [Phlegmacium glaucopus]|nr:hypothetical protein BYT27DRAFT_7164032 [Phlegmacium glaucopus]
MAAACSHVLTNVPAHSETRRPSHSRDLSIVSSATLHTNTTTTVHSQPIEPLLRPTTPRAGHDHDVSSHQSRNPETLLGLPRWSQSRIMSLRHSAAILSDKGFTERNPLKRVKLLRRIKNVLAILMALWAVYSTVRYLLAFYIYGSLTGQAISITLGAITGLSFALTCCATILGFVQPHLLIHGFAVQPLLTMGSILQYSASCCLFGPTVVNFILVFVWKNTTDQELQTRRRCGLDIDLVWSPSFSLCNRKTRNWGLWVALSVIRLVITLIIIITFHSIASSIQLTPVRRTKSRRSQDKKAHHRLESYLTPLIPGNGHSKSSVVEPHLGGDSGLPCQSSDSILSTKASPRNRLRPNRSRLSAFSEDDIQIEAPNDNNPDFLPMNSDRVEPEGESNNFVVHRFRSLIAQIARETDEGLVFARSDGSGSSHHTVDSPPNQSPELGTEAIYRIDHQEDYDHEDDFYTSSATQVNGSYERQQYPAVEEIRMLNGFIRRMPTIESMGSHELLSSMGASSTHRDRERIGVSSTLNTLVSRAGTDLSGTSEPHSQRNSLTAQAEVLTGLYHSTEIGELIRRGDTIRKVDTSTNTNADNSGSLGASTNSSSVLSYLTAPGSITKSLVIPSSELDASPYVPSSGHPNLKETAG